MPRLEIFTGAERRRRWREADKLAVLEEASSPGISAASVARRHNILPQQIYRWRRQFAWAAPAGFGDFAGDDPIVGTSRELVASFGALSQGRLFERLDEVIIGARVDRSIGAHFKPMHGQA